MIPKMLHYIWLGSNEPNNDLKQYMKTWKKFAGYKIKGWDESNISQYNLPFAIKKAYEYRKYAFVTDYLRLKILDQYGGIYLDTDVEIFKDLTSLIESGGGTDLLLGMIYNASIGTAVIASKEDNCLLKDLMLLYDTAEYSYNEENADFKLIFKGYEDFKIINNNDLFTAYFLKNVPGFRLGNYFQEIVYNDEKGNCKVRVVPKEYLEGYSTLRRNNYSVHHCFGSWRTTNNSNNESIALKNIKKVYFFRYVADKIKRNSKKNLPFKKYCE